MDELTRIQKDITMFETNQQQLPLTSLPPSQQHIIELAQQYYSDTKYYVTKKDLFTAFGCINYAHGLLDALIKQQGETL
jgi:hypothetical protein